MCFRFRFQLSKCYRSTVNISTCLCYDKSTSCWGVLVSCQSKQNLNMFGWTQLRPQKLAADLNKVAMCERKGVITLRKLLRFNTCFKKRSKVGEKMVPLLITFSIYMKGGSSQRHGPSVWTSHNMFTSIMLPPSRQRFSQHANRYYLFSTFPLHDW